VLIGGAFVSAVSSSWMIRKVTMDQASAAVQELKWRIAQLEGELERERLRRQAIESATFWRATAPLRALLGPLTTLRRRLRGAIGRRMIGPAPPVVAGLAKLPAVVAEGLPSAALSGAASSAFMFIEFIWEKTARPCDVGLGADSRMLAAGFQRVILRDAEGAIFDGVDFRAGGNSLGHVCYGFSFIEDWGTWTQGRRSLILMWTVGDLPETLYLDVEASSFAEAFSVNTAEVKINGVDLGVAVFGTSQSATIAFESSAVTKSGLSASYGLNQSLVSDAKPDVSIIILNYNKPGITLACVIAILQAKTQKSYEIIVLDNGSGASEAQKLKSLNLPVRLISLNANRFFGEGNNIAAEYARADALLFLNNDAFLDAETVDLLLEALFADESVGAVGPVFRYPDGALQEAGAFINTDGTAFQRGKGVPDFDVKSLPPLDPVDYISAACVMIRRDDFIRLGGFDLRYDPAYYEDSDLCLRLRALGKSTLLVRDATVRHIENATTSDPRNKGLATDIIERHRSIFLTRWSDWLEDRSDARLPQVVALDPAKLRAIARIGREASKINAVFSPFPLVHGGGERYLLGAGLALSSLGPTAFATPDDYSAVRLNTLLKDLGYPTGVLFPESEMRLQARDVDAFVLMGNELLPTREGYGRRRIYHCQFPFPTNEEEPAVAAGKRNLASYQNVVVNSEFTREAYRRALSLYGIAGVDIRVVYPPVQLVAPDPRAQKENLILSIGRFSPRGHSKRQDLLVDTFARLSGAELKGWELVLCGVVPNNREAIEYYEEILSLCRGLPAKVVLAPSRRQVEDYLRRAKIYVSTTGAGVKLPKDYWRCEHFGITVVEAASAGCIPVSYDIGGPAEIIAHLGVGATFSSDLSLGAAICAAAAQTENPISRLQVAEAAKRYNEATFFDAWRALLSG